MYLFIVNKLTSYIIRRRHRMSDKRAAVLTFRRPINAATQSVFSYFFLMPKPLPYYDWGLEHYFPIINYTFKTNCYKKQKTRLHKTKMKGKSPMLIWINQLPILMNYSPCFFFFLVLCSRVPYYWQFFITVIIIMIFLVVILVLSSLIWFLSCSFQCFFFDKVHQCRTAAIL